MPITHSKIVPKVAIIHIWHQDKGVLVDLIRIIRDHAYSSSEGVFGDDVPLDILLVAFALLSWRGRR
jgi:hypothetical protein